MKVSSPQEFTELDRVRAQTRIFDQLRLTGLTGVKLDSKVHGIRIDIAIPKHFIAITTHELSYDDRNILAANKYTVFYAVDLSIIQKGIIIDLVQKLIPEQRT